MNLKPLRKKIDAIDSNILKLLNARAEVVSEIGKLKGRLKQSVYAPEREKSVYDRLVSENKGPLSDESVKAVFREVMSGALQLERPLRIAYLGPEYTFTHLAGLKKFGVSVDYTACETITDVFSEVEKGRADYGVVPVENSIEGAISHTLDMFIDSDLKICSEIYMEVSHNLLSKEKEIGKIRKIYTKSQVFGQCRHWIELNLPRAELVDVSSTAKAAEIAAKTRGAACIASEPAGKKYGLKTLAGSIEDNVHNVTKFFVIGRTYAKPTRQDKTSIMFSVKDKAGALHDILIPFKKYRINMTKIESRPSKVRAWEYYFFVDIEGHCLDKKVQKALVELKKVSSYIKILGSYPAGDSV